MPKKTLFVFLPLALPHSRKVVVSRLKIGPKFAFRLRLAEGPLLAAPAR
jgi:hypothetical protein